MKTNKEWHLNNRMPPRATLDQRIEWHLKHIKNCGCRPIPQKLEEKISKRNAIQNKQKS